MEKKKRLIVIPLAGLGNRMRVLSSCVQIAKRDNRELWVVWPVNADVGCDMESIFQDIGMDYSVPPKWISYLLINLYRLAAIERFFGVYKFVSRWFSDYSIFDRDIYDSESQLEVSSDHPTIFVASCLAFNSLDYKQFEFKDHLIKEVDQECKKIRQPYIGVHVRRTDHVNTTKHSPDQNYFYHIDRILKENPDQMFFLATDDLDTKSNFREKYRGKIHSLDRKLRRDDLEGIYGGVIELIMLSRSSKILCSAISSYSTAAILLGDIKDVVLVDSFLENGGGREAMLTNELRNL